MKQHITKYQAKFLGKEKFYSMFDELVDRDDWANYHHKKVTIGKMIEVLDDKVFTWELYKLDKRGEYSYYDTVVIKIKEFESYIGFNNTELCDALFEALCYVLEGEV